MRQPREFAAATESATEWKHAGRAGVQGYGVMAVPFGSGHVLGLRNWTATSNGTPLRSIWHRFPDGSWEFVEDGAVGPVTCSVWFGETPKEQRRSVPLTITWTGPRSFEVTAEDGSLDWKLEVAPTAVTRMMSAMASVIPLALWTSPLFLRVMGVMATLMMGSGRMGLVGESPNGKRFLANPLRVWRVTSSSAVIDGVDIGAPAPLDPQAALGDFLMPQHGIFAMGRVFQPE